MEQGAVISAGSAQRNEIVGSLWAGLCIQLEFQVAVSGVKGHRHLQKVDDVEVNKVPRDRKQQLKSA